MWSLSKSFKKGNKAYKYSILLSKNQVHCLDSTVAYHL